MIKDLATTFPKVPAIYLCYYNDQGLPVTTFFSKRPLNLYWQFENTIKTLWKNELVSTNKQIINRPREEAPAPQQGWDIPKVIDHMWCHIDKPNGHIIWAYKLKDRIKHISSFNILYPTTFVLSGWEYGVRSNGRWQVKGVTPPDNGAILDAIGVEMDDTQHESKLKHAERQLHLHIHSTWETI